MRNYQFEVRVISRAEGEADNSYRDIDNSEKINMATKEQIYLENESENIQKNVVAMPNIDANEYRIL